MRITQEADYALRICAFLSKSEKPVGAPQLSEELCIPERFTSKILRRLMLSGLTTSSRGAYGGFSLSIPARDLSLLRVIEAIDGPIAIRHCLDDGHICTYSENKDTCRFHCVFEELNRMLRSRLDMLSIEDITSNALPVSTLLERIK